MWHLRSVFDLIEETRPEQPEGFSQSSREVPAKFESPLPQPDLSAAALRDLAKAWVREGGYMSNDILELGGALNKPATWGLAVNGGKPFKLQRRPFLLLGILFAFGLRLDQPTDKSKRRFLPTETIADAIERLTAESSPFAGFWQFPTANEVHRTVHKFREKLRKAGNSMLVESGDRGAGYRISVPQANLVLNEGAAVFGTALREVMKLPRQGGSGEVER
jgi:hypothetical protein